MNKPIELKGRVFLTFDIQAITSLHIGGSDTGIEIGGVDKTVVRDPLTNRPYIPGSSLKGKMRSLLEKYRGLKQNQRIGQGYIHSCGAEYRGEELRKKGKAEYEQCDVCQVFGVPSERGFSTPARLVVRDVHMDPDSAEKLEMSGRTDLPYTEIKTETSIDRVTSAANPRQMERVPAGTVFGGAELVYSIYDGADCNPEKDIQRLKTLVEGLQLIEDDYLGGLGTRGSGKVKFTRIKLTVRGRTGPGEPSLESQELGHFDSVQALRANLDSLQAQLNKLLV